MQTWCKWHEQIPAEETVLMETSIPQTRTHPANTLASCTEHSSCTVNGKLPSRSVACKSKKSMRPGLNFSSARAAMLWQWESLRLCRLTCPVLNPRGLPPEMPAALWSSALHEAGVVTVGLGVSGAELLSWVRKWMLLPARQWEEKGSSNKGWRQLL